MKSYRKIKLSSAFIVAVLVSFLFPKIIYAQQSGSQLPGYQTRINLISQEINTRLSDPKAGLYFETADSSKNENKYSYLWPLCALVQAANEMEVLEPKKQYMPPVVVAIDKYLNDQPPVPAYQATAFTGKFDDRYYDDNQWVAIAYLDAYQRNSNKKYLAISEDICHFMLSGLDTVSGGGIYWREKDKTSKNTCSNGPGILVLLQLYKITHKTEYLKSAQDIYQWTNAHLQAPSGVYYDNIRLPSLQIAKATYTYNTGTMLQSNVLLYQITKDKKYLLEAERIAQAGKDLFFKGGRLPNGNYWFNAVMLRGYEELYKVDRNMEWVNFFKQDADAIWNTERDANNLLGPKAPKRLIDQAAMIEIYARLQEIENMK